MCGVAVNIGVVLKTFGLTIGVDDDKGLHRLHHACWPVTEGKHRPLALCATKRLWGFDVGGDPNRIDCTTCLERLGVLGKGAR